MNRLTDQQYVREQYKDASNFGARVDLYKRFSSNPAGLQHWVFDLMKLPAQSRILEVGCGPGGLWLSNRDRISPDWEVSLTDLSPGMLEQARSSLGGVQHVFVYAAADARALPFGDSSFDTVVANHMLYHIPDKGKALAEIKRVLAPNGHLYATTLGKDHLRELGELAHAYNPAAPRIWSRLTESFGAENGLDTLAPFFSTVIMHSYEDTLVATEAAPMVAYIRSTALRPFFDETGFTRFIDEQLAERGPISIRSDTVMFEAYHARL